MADSRARRQTQDLAETSNLASRDNWPATRIAFSSQTKNLLLPTSVGRCQQSVSLGLMILPQPREGVGFPRFPANCRLAPDFVPGFSGVWQCSCGSALAPHVAMTRTQTIERPTQR
jgi:hypothetical protein